MPVRARGPRAAEARRAYNAVRVPFRKAGRPEVEALSGQRHVPLLVIDGEAICDSKRIVEHLDYMRSRPDERSP